MNQRVLALLVFVFSIASFSNAQAQLLGKTFRIDWLYPNESTIFKFVSKSAGAGAEVNCPGNYQPGDTSPICQFSGPGPVSIDVDASSVTINSTGNTYNTVAYNGFRFTFAPGTPRVLGASLTTNNPSAASSRVTFTDNSVAINMQGLDEAGMPLKFYTINITFAAASPIPTLSAWPLFALMLSLPLSIILICRRKYEVSSK